MKLLVQHFKFFFALYLRIVIHTWKWCNVQGGIKSSRSWKNAIKCQMHCLTQRYKFWVNNSSDQRKRLKFWREKSFLLQYDDNVPPHNSILHARIFSEELYDCYSSRSMQLWTIPSFENEIAEPPFWID